MKENSLMSIDSAAHMAGVGVDSVRQAIRRGNIKVRYIVHFGDAKVTLLDCADVTRNWTGRHESRFLMRRFLDLESETITITTPEREFRVLGGLLTVEGCSDGKWKRLDEK